MAGANVPDDQLLRATLEAVILERPPVEPPEWPQHLCLDHGYDTPAGWQTCIDHDYHPHIALRGAPPPPRPTRHPARRWVVERTLAWLNQCRAILIRWEHRAENYLGLLQLACALLRFRRLHRLTATSR